MTQIAQKTSQTASKKHDRSGAVQNQPAPPATVLQPTGERPAWLGPRLALQPTKADLRWLDGVPTPAVFDHLNLPWWQLVVPVIRQTLATWKQRAATRRALAEIDAATLRDAGISPGMAAFEASQPFWRAPVILRDIADKK